MGNANGREDLANGDPDDPSTGSNGELRFRSNYLPNSIPPPARLPSPDLMANSPPASPARFRSPLMFAPQHLAAKQYKGCDSSFFYRDNRISGTHVTYGIYDIEGAIGLVKIIKKVPTGEFYPWLHLLISEPPQTTFHTRDWIVMMRMSSKNTSFFDRNKDGVVYPWETFRV
ncbi:unnamed protein product [Camellia sinensis]